MARHYCRFEVEIIADCLPMETATRMRVALAREFGPEFLDDIEVTMNFHSGACSMGYCGSIGEHREEE
jgi:hypothetical protein